MLLAGRILSSQLAPARSADDLITWTPLAEARQRATVSRKLILYDFSAEWCGPCKDLDEDVFRDPVMAKKINDRFIAVRVVDRQQEDGSNPPPVESLQRAYSVRAFPTVVIADVDGHQKDRVEGFSGRRPFEQMIDRVR